MYYPEKMSNEPWKRFLAAEYKQLRARQRGQFRLALGTPLPWEFEEVIEWLANDDQRRANEGLVEIETSGHTYYKHIEELTPQDMSGRLTAEMNRYMWLMNRMDERARLIREDRQEDR